MRDSAFEAETVEAVHYRRQHTLQILDWLGHCDVEFSEAGSKIYASPPALARLPISGLPQAVLCGARAPQSIRNLREVCSRRGRSLRISALRQKTELNFIPLRVAVEAESEAELVSLAKEAGLDFDEIPPSWRLLQFCGELECYLAACEWESGPDLNWPHRDFDVTHLQFRSQYTETEHNRLSSYANPVQPGYRHQIWQGKSWTLIDRDWGRYALLRETNVSVLVYDPEAFLFAVPVGAPLPRLFARVLTLCSGYAPRFVIKKDLPFHSPEQRGFNIFSGVPPEIANTIAAKLSQKLNLESLGNLSRSKR